MEARARDWMSARPHTVSRRTPIFEVASTFASNRVTSVPVVEDGRVVGIVSRSDLVARIACEHNLAGSMFDDLRGLEDDPGDERAAQIAEFLWRRVGDRTVDELMTSSPITVSAEQSLREVARTLVAHRIHHVPVVDGAELVGVISTFDLARWLAGEQPGEFKTSERGDTAMGTIQERLHDDVEKLRQRRDELRVQLDLGKMEAAEAWEQVEHRWQRLEGKLGVLKDESKEAGSDVAEAARLLVDEIREGFAKLARHL